MDGIALWQNELLSLSGWHADIFPRNKKIQPPVQHDNYVAPIAQLVSALDLITSSVQVEGSILTAGKRLSLKNLNVIIRAIN